MMSDLLSYQVTVNAIRAQTGKTGIKASKLYTVSVTVKYTMANATSVHHAQYKHRYQVSISLLKPHFTV